MSHARLLASAAIAACLMFAACGQTSEQAQNEAATTTEVAAATTPGTVGECVDTTVSETGSRLEGVPDSGSSVVYANGTSQVSYDVIEGISHSQTGDSIRLCLVSIPENCPAGDDRGRVYGATNARTGESWTAPDSQHMCGGA
ncbi:MAG: hypothetical protein NT015_18110 [Alphaproteobacteria bacterium]|nr:hypothetical protein [Alphaproteobacteria bacterium]